MIIHLESTSRVVTLKTPDGYVSARLWEGKSDQGVPLHAYITRIAVNHLDDAAEFEREMASHRDPSPMLDELLEEAQLPLGERRSALRSRV